MAQTKKKRRRKHRGTQGGRIDRSPKRGRPRNRAEAKARARQSRGRGKKRGPAQRQLRPPTWGSAIMKGLVAAGLFLAMLVLAFKRPVPASAGLAAFMLAFYVPMGYYIDKMFYRRNLRKQEQERIERSQRGDKEKS